MSYQTLLCITWYLDKTNMSCTGLAYKRCYVSHVHANTETGVTDLWRHQCMSIPYTCMCTYILCTEAMSTPYRIAFRANRKSYSVNGKGTELEQVVHTHRTSYRSGWPGGFGELNASLYSWIFTSVSVDSISLSYLFTSSTVEVPVHIATKRGRKWLSDMWRSTWGIGAEQLCPVTRIAPKSPLLCLNRSPKSSMVFLSA